MPLIFPTNPSIGQTYQSGSSGVFVYNGEAWDSQNSNVPITVTSASFAVTASNATTVIANPIAVPANTGSYVDLGQVRFQWGTNTNPSTQLRTVTLPAPFRDTTYSVTGNVVDQSTSDDRPISIGTRTTTTFQARPTVNASVSASPFNWIAIGLKP
jgi:hypothetical protein